ncbi:MAG: peptidoglycan DD-metalloendopeptidase family protein [Burkholderiales bacterium]|nr:peptidoglycan DD-metalloendopeptidase family protein [Burkholderiales bacterium]
MKRRVALAAVFGPVAAALLAGCTARAPAPVVDRTPPPKAAPAAKQAAVKPASRPEFYTVRAGDTLYSIALDHGVDYRELAAWNGIGDPAAIRTGQRLRLVPPGASATAAPFKSAPGVVARPVGEGAARPAPPAAASDAVKTQPQGVRVPYSDEVYAQLANLKPPPPPAAKPEAPPAPAPGEGESVQFSWPASGRIVNNFSDGANLKGIGIAGRMGQPVYAAAPGRVIFSGTGIRGFGKLIVIKHNDTFLSVYGHNNELTVKEGQNVTRGQQIAEMGNTDADQVKLHFEIRRYGKPVDPLKLLPPPG